MSDDYYDKTDERVAEGDYLLDEEQYERQSRALRKEASELHWNEIKAAQDARYEAWRLKTDHAEECAA